MENQQTIQFFIIIILIIPIHTKITCTFDEISDRIYWPETYIDRGSI